MKHFPIKKHKIKNVKLNVQVISEDKLNEENVKYITLPLILLTNIKKPKFYGKIIDELN
jgi:hypothetical protein